MIEIVAVCIGTVAVGALAKGALLLVQETRVAVRVMEERAAQAQMKFANLREARAKIHDADRQLNNSVRAD